MSASQNDRNLLVGILALQMDFVSQEQLILAMQTWMLNKSQTMEQLLVDKGIISTEMKDLLSAIAESHLRFHANRVEHSLAALSSLSSVREKLANLKDQDVDSTMVRAEDIRLAKTKRQSNVGILSEPSITFIPRPSESSGRFRVLRLHAQGGLGVVSVAEDTELHREVALKEIQAPHAEDPSSRARFLMEAEVTGRLEHPGIVPVYSLGTTTTGNPFYVMRFIRGDSLKDSISRLHGTKLSNDEFALSLRKLIRRLIDVCNAIEYAHSRGVMHRDLKPGNIMLGKYGETLVVDWGLAKVVGRKSLSNTDEATFIPMSGEGSTETRMGSVVGTLAYMSPEQASGKLDQLGPRSDVYCLGATLYCALTGHPPIEKGNTEEMLEVIRSGRIRPVQEANAVIDPAIAAICHKAMSVVPSQRYESAAAMADDLELWLTDQPIKVWREPILQRAGRWLRKHQTIAASFGVLVVSIFIALIVFNNITRRQNNELRKAQLAEKNSRKLAEKRLVTARDVTLNLVDVAEQALSQADSAKRLREDLMDDAYGMFGDLYREDPANEANASLFARIARIAGNQKQLLSKASDADKRFQSAEAALRQLRKEQPSNEAYQVNLAELLRDIARLRRLQDRLSDADNALAEARVLVGSINSPQRKAEVDRILAWVGNSEISLKQEQWQLDAALGLANESIATFKAYLQSGKAHPNDQQFLIIAMYRKGRVLDLMDRTEDSIQAFDEAIAEIQTVGAVHGTKAYSVELIRTMIWSAQARSRGAEVLHLAREHVSEAKRLLEPMVAKPNASPSIILYWADVNKVAGQIELLSGDLPKAEVTLKLAIETAEKLVSAKDASYHNASLAESLGLLARVERSKGNGDSSDALHRRAVATMEKACSQLPESGELKYGLQKLLQFDQ